MGKDECFEVSWIHCNSCFRSFEHHSRLAIVQDQSGKQKSEHGDEFQEYRLEALATETLFSITSCGHIFCDVCIQQQTVNMKFICTVCADEGIRDAVTPEIMPIKGAIPRSMELFLKPPIGLVEDALTAMNFQLGNACRLIRGLRGKVSQQREILDKAKREIASGRQLRAKILELERENASLRDRLEKVTLLVGPNAPAQDTIRVDMHQKRPFLAIGTPAGRPSPRSGAIGVPGRFSLRSPVMVQPVSRGMSSSSHDYRHSDPRFAQMGHEYPKDSSRPSYKLAANIPSSPLRYAQRQVVPSIRASQSHEQLINDYHKSPYPEYSCGMSTPTHQKRSLHRGPKEGLYSSESSTGPYNGKW
jgi:hypothetical protein